MTADDLFAEYRSAMTSLELCVLLNKEKPNTAVRKTCTVICGKEISAGLRGFIRGIGSSPFPHGRAMAEIRLYKETFPELVK